MSAPASADLAATLQAGIQALGLHLDASQQQSLLDFLDLLQKWNKVYNLTAVRNPQEMLTHHLLDSLAAVPALQRHLATLPAQQATQARLLDVGCGGGLPGVVFAICCPQLTVHCVDTVAKKAAFIQQAAASLHLANLTGIHARVESLTGPYAVVSSRAFAALADFTAWSRPAIAADGVWLAMKGKQPDEEMAAVDATLAQVFHVEPLAVPGLDAQRCIVWLRPVPA